MTEFSAILSFRGIAPGKSWIGDVSLKDYKTLWKKNKGNENKIILEDFNCTMDKMDKKGENKTKILYLCCSSYVRSKPIVDNGLEDLWRRENPVFLSLPATIGLLSKIQDRRGLY